MFKKQLAMLRIELLWSLSGMRTVNFLHCHVSATYSICLNPVNVLITKFDVSLHGQTDAQDRLLCKIKFGVGDSLH